MKNILIVFISGMLLNFAACSDNQQEQINQTANKGEATPAGGQENVKDDQSKKDIVKTAIGSKDHTTLVAAIKQADLVTTLSNAGPFTVFAPTNAAFGKLPAGTVDGMSLIHISEPTRPY